MSTPVSGPFGSPEWHAAAVKQMGATTPPTATPLQTSFSSDPIEMKLGRLRIVAGKKLPGVHVDDVVLYDDIAAALTELNAAKAELVRFKESTWEHDEFNRKHAVARSIERDNDKDELARLRVENEIFARDAGLYAATLQQSASLLDCEISLVDLEVNKLITRAERAEADLARANRESATQSECLNESTLEVADLTAQLAALAKACHLFLEARKHSGYGMADAETAIRAAIKGT